MDTILVVGDKFAAFGRHPGVMTISELKALVDKGDRAALPPQARLVPGQGVRETDIQALLEASRGFAVDVSPLEQHPVRAGRIHTHKHFLHNSIIAAPARVNDALFETALLLDERSELMSDHQTGQHIQGMILIEASRQTLLAVTEEFFIGNDNHDRYYFVLQEVETKFINFVFPVDVKIRYEVLDMDTSSASRLRFTTKTSFTQGDICCAEVMWKFTAYLASRIEAKENEMAASLVQRLAAPNGEGAASTVVNLPTAAAKAAPVVESVPSAAVR